MQPIITENPQFFTAIILEMERLLQPGKYKDIPSVSEATAVILCATLRHPRNCGTLTGEKNIHYSQILDKEIKQAIKKE